MVVVVNLLAKALKLQSPTILLANRLNGLVPIASTHPAGPLFDKVESCALALGAFVEQCQTGQSVATIGYLTVGLIVLAYLICAVLGRPSAGRF